MALGGKRPGSGRKKGGANLKTREIANKAAEEGITPLEVMLEAMRFHYFHDELDQAAAIAKDAAPYMHPRLATVTVGNKPGESFKTENVNALDVIQGRLDVIAARRGAEGDTSKPH